jgi:hypothetical protein
MWARKLIEQMVHAETTPAAGRPTVIPLRAA